MKISKLIILTVSLLMLRSATFAQGIKVEVDNASTNTIRFGLFKYVNGIPANTCGMSACLGLSSATNSDGSGNAHYGLAWGPDGCLAVAGVIDLGTTPPSTQVDAGRFTLACSGNISNVCNCHYNVVLTNNTPYANLYGLFKGSSFSGYSAYVYAGQSVSFSVMDDSCNPSAWVWKRILSGQLTGGSSTTQSGGIVSSGQTGTGIVPFGGDTSPGWTVGTNTAPTDNGITSPQGNPLGQTTNGIVNFGTNSTPTNGLNNGTFEAGLNALYNAETMGLNNVIGAISNLANRPITNNVSLTNNMTNAVTVSNSIVVTNIGNTNDYTGLLTSIRNFTSNAQDLISATNAVYATINGAGGDIATMSNLAGAVVGNFTNHWGSLVNAGAWTNFGSDDWSAGSDISIPFYGGAMTMTIPSQAGANWAPFRALIIALIWLYTVVEMLKVTQGWVNHLYTTPQLEGNKQEILGFSADAPIAVAYAAVFAAMLVALPVALATFFAPGISGIGDLNSLFHAVTGGAEVANLVLTLVPVYAMLAAFFTYFAFRYLFGYAIFLLSITVVKFLIA